MLAASGGLAVRVEVAENSTTAAAVAGVRERGGVTWEVEVSMPMGVAREARGKS